jgi:3-oxoacyl-[acyl-carrier-protein] synthase-3
MILGTGAYLPPLRVTNKKIESFGHKNAKWTQEKLGIKERRVSFAPSSELGAKAALLALADARMKPSDIETLIVATSTPDKMNPSTACIIQDKIKAYNAVCFDINAVCSGFLYALTLVRGTTLVIGVDTFSHITDWRERDCVFFGDGAGAVIANEVPGEFILQSDGTGRRAFETPHGGTFSMDGKAVFKEGTTILPAVISLALNKAHLTIDDIDWLLPHQASKNMLKELARIIGLPWGKVKTNMEKYGNTAAASIPILLHENDFKKGDKLLLAAIGSGWTYGAMIIEW